MVSRCAVKENGTSSLRFRDKKHVDTFVVVHREVNDRIAINDSNVVNKIVLNKLLNNLIISRNLLHILKRKQIFIEDFYNRRAETQIL